MPIKPTTQDLNANSVQILNAIRSDATPQYRAAVPVAEGNTASIRAIGDIIMSYQPHQNEFLKALVNRIGRVIITSKLYENPWSMFKKGLLEFGETVEEIFVNIAKPHQFNPAVAETDVFKREIPDVRAAFHTMNYQKFYKATISNDQLRQAFLSWNGITDLIAKIVDAMYTGANYDEFITMKYLIARMLLNGNIHQEVLPTVAGDDYKPVVSVINGISNTLPFLSTKYNMNGVATYTNKDDQFIILTAKFASVINVEVLAQAFNMDRAEFIGHQVMVDSFSNIDSARLAELFADDPGYTPLTAEEIAALEDVPAVILDRDWFMIFDNFYNFTEQYNGEGLYWNYWYHVWKTFSASPFANAIAFNNTAPTVTAVTVSPATATVSKGQTAQLSATVTGTGLTPKGVTWTITGGTSANTGVTQTGFVTVGADETATSLTVTATSTFDNTKSGTSTITVPA